MPYRKDSRKPSETKWGRCPDCESSDVLLHLYEYPDPHWDDDQNYPPQWPQPMLKGWHCALCRDTPRDPRKAICYVGNLLLKELAKIDAKT